MSLWIEALNTAITSSLHKEDGPPSPSAPEKKYVLLYIFVHTYIHTNVWLEFLCKPKVHCVLNNFSGLITVQHYKEQSKGTMCLMKPFNILLPVKTVIKNTQNSTFRCFKCSLKFRSTFICLFKFCKNHYWCDDKFQFLRPTIKCFKSAYKRRLQCLAKL